MSNRTALPPRPARRTPSDDVDLARRHADRRLCVAARRNWREVMRDPSVLDPKIRAYLEAENAYAKAALAHTEALQETLFAEMKGRIKEDDSSVPSPTARYAYYMRYREGGQHPIALPPAARRRRRGRSCSTATRSRPAKPYFQLGEARHSPDHRLIAWSADDKGSEYYTLRVRDLASGARPCRHRCRTRRARRYGPRIRAAFYYVRLDAQSSPLARLPASARHAGGDDALVYEEADSRFFVSLGETQSRPLRRRSRCTITRPPKCWLIDLADRRTRRRGWSRRASTRCNTTSSIIPTGRRRGAGHPHQCRRRRGFQDRARAARPPGARATGAISCRTGAGVYPARITVLADWLVRLEREDGLPRIVVRAARERRGAHDRISPRRPIRSASTAATNSRPTRCAFTTRR